jgi:hypothetical protein
MAPDRPNQFKILLSDEERTMLDALAESSGVTASDYLRIVIRREHEQLGTVKTGFGPGPKRAASPTRPRTKK